VIRGTVSAWATSLGKEPRTLERLLVRAGLPKPHPRFTVTASAIFAALLGDEMALKRRLTLAQAEAQERENREAEGQLIRLVEVEKILSERVILPLRELLMAAPAALDTRCNPGAPELARLALTAWRDDALKTLRGALGEKDAAALPLALPPPGPRTSRTGRTDRGRGRGRGRRRPVGRTGALAKKRKRKRGK